LLIFRTLQPGGAVCKTPPPGLIYQG